MTAVKNAISNHRCDVVKHLAELGCDVNMTDADGWYVPCTWQRYRIWWRRTGACYTAKLTFSNGSSIKVWGAYYTNVRIIFEFLR